MNKIIFDCAYIENTKNGVAKFSTYLINELDKETKVEVISNKSNFKNFKKFALSPSSITHGKGLIGMLKRFFWYRKKFKFDKNLLISGSHYHYKYCKNQIITIHDLIPINKPMNNFIQYLYFKFFLRKTLKKIKAVITVSNTTKNLIIKEYNYPAEKIIILPNIINKQILNKKIKSESIQTQLGINENYLLVVGAKYRHKNIEEIINYSDLWRNKYYLVIVSSSEAYQRKLYKLSKKHECSEKIIFLAGVSDHDLSLLYSNATALVYPSIDEGFGIPPLESIAHGTPVILSDIPIFKEVMNEGGIYIDLGSKKSWSMAFQEIEDPKIIIKKLQHGNQRLRKYGQNTFQTELKKFLQVYYYEKNT